MNNFNLHLINYTLVGALQLASLSPCAACIWQGGENAYWPSTNIPVCFVNLDARVQKQRAAEVIRSAFVGLHASSNFRFSGFQRCNETPPLAARVRISLDSDNSVGRAESIGPSSATASVNLHLPLNANDGSGLHEISRARLSGTAVHELFHLLGFRHDSPRGQTGFGRFLADNPHTVLNGPYDIGSIMSDDRIDQPSRNDLECLMLVSRRSLRSTVDVGSLTDTTAKPQKVVPAIPMSQIPEASN